MVKQEKTIKYEDDNEEDIFIFKCEKCKRKFKSTNENQAKNNATVHELNCKMEEK